MLCYASAVICSLIKICRENYEYDSLLDEKMEHKELPEAATLTLSTLQTAFNFILRLYDQACRICQLAVDQGGRSGTVYHLTVLDDCPVIILTLAADCCSEVTRADDPDQPLHC